MLALTLLLAALMPAAGPLIDSMDENLYRPPAKKARAEVVDGKVGKAVLFRFDDDARSAFFTTNRKATPEWDSAEGFSFWVKGDGAGGFGGMEFIYDDDYAVRYDVAFPVKGREWTKVTFAWSDLIPVLPGARSKPLGTKDGNRPSKLSGPWVGKWWYWGDYPSISFAIDEIRLEPKVDRDNSEHRPEGAPLARTLAKLKAGKPVTIVTMGDSLTDKRHWANREVAWVDILRDRLRTDYKSVPTIVNPAIGGTQLRQNLILMPRWLSQAPEPDLVTIFFGGNDWDAGMRGPEFQKACEDAIDRVRRATGGKSDVLLMTTNPADIRWNEATELAEACRAAARSRNAGLADTDEAFRKAGKDESGRKALFVEDRVHLGKPGHTLVVETVLKAIEGLAR